MNGDELDLNRGSEVLVLVILCVLVWALLFRLLLWLMTPASPYHRPWWRRLRRWFEGY